MSISPAAKKVVDEINKKHGGVVVLASDITQVGKRFTTGSVTWDYALGGGLPANQWHELIGEPSHGKSALALKCIAANQAINPDFTAVWLASEPWVPAYAEMLGVDTNRTLVIATTSMEEGFDAVLKFTESQSVDCAVIDSLPHLLPDGEDESGIGDATVALGAKMTNKFFRKMGKAMHRSLTEAERPMFGIMVNQWRFKIGVTHGDPRTTPGGVGKDFAYFTRTEVRRDEWIEIGPQGNKNRVGQRLRMRTIKNKSFPPQRVAYVDFYFAEGGTCPAGEYDYGKEIASMAIVKEIVERTGSWYRYKGDKWNGMAPFVEEIRGNLTLRDELVDLIGRTIDDPRGAVTADD